MKPRKTKQKGSPFVVGTDPFADITADENEQIDNLRRIETEARAVEKQRELTQLDLNHWWTEKSKASKTRFELKPDEAKAAVIYEAMRRHPEVQQAWLDGRPRPDWQRFVNFVVNNLHHPWPRLQQHVQKALIRAMLNPLFEPPIGYSTFPHESSDEECERATLQRLSLPQTDDNGSAQSLLAILRRLQEAGFIFVAIDHKAKKRDKYALTALRKLLKTLKPTLRKSDLRAEVANHLPSNLSKTARSKLDKKAAEGTLSQQDFDEAWDECVQAGPNLGGEWHQTATVREGPIGKRKRRGLLIEEKLFDFFAILKELGALDKGTIKRSDFVGRLRLS